MNPQISVIIPTHNRAVAILRCLTALLKSEFAHPYEVIVVNDSSTDETVRVVENLKSQPGLSNLVLFSLPKGGPAKARNFGISQAHAKTVLFLGDDCVAYPTLLHEHYSWHCERFPSENFAVLGLTSWSPEMVMTPFLRWVDQKRLQFSYDRLTSEDSPTPGCFWTSNLSLKKSFLEKHGVFDEDFPEAVWEDTELGHRLGKKGLVIKYNRAAVVDHYHPTTLATFKKRMETHGYSQMIFARKLGKEYPYLLFRQPWRFFWEVFDKLLTFSGFLYLLEKLAHFLEKRRIITPVFYLVLQHYKLKGVKRYETSQNRHC